MVYIALQYTTFCPAANYDYYQFLQAFIHMIKKLGLSAIILFQQQAWSSADFIINDPGNTDTISYDSFTMTVETGDITVLLPDSKKISKLSLADTGDTVFMELDTFQVRLCSMERFSVNADGVIKYTAVPGTPCLSSSSQQTNICDQDKVLLLDHKVNAGNTFICRGNQSISAVNEVLEEDSVTKFTAPEIFLYPGLRVKAGAAFHAITP